MKADIFDATTFLNEKCDIWNHPIITDRQEIQSFEVAELMADFANSYTGFTDKNGKEIYEGDRLLRRVPDEMEESGICDIVMDVEMFNGCWICKEIDFDYSDAKFPEDYTFLYEVANESKITEK